MFLKIPFSSDVVGFSEMRRIEKQIIITKGVGMSTPPPGLRSWSGKETMSFQQGGSSQDGVAEKKNQHFPALPAPQVAPDKRDHPV